MCPFGKKGTLLDKLSQQICLGAERARFEYHPLNGGAHSQTKTPHNLRDVLSGEGGGVLRSMAWY